MTWTKKIIIISLLIFATTYSAAWLIAAKITSAKVTEAFETLKKDGKIKNYSANVSVSGFPFNFDINLEHFKVDVDLPDRAGFFNILYNGMISFRLGFFSSYIKLIIDGDLHLEGSIEGRKLDILSTGEKILYQVELNNFLLSPTTIHTLTGSIKDPKLIINAVKEISVGAQKLRVFNKISNSNIFYADKLNIGVSIESTKDGISGNYTDNIVNAEFYKDSIMLYNDINRIPAVQKFTQSINPKILAYFKVFTFPDFGKINHDINIDFSQIKDEQSIKIKRLSLKDNFQDIEISGSALNATMKKETDLKAKISITSKGYDLLAIYLDNLETKSLFFSQNINSDSFLYTIVNPFDKIVRATSKDKKYSIKTVLKDFGVISIISKFKYSIDQDKSYQADIDQISLSTNKFSIGVKGDIRNKNKKDTYSLKLKVDNYVYIIDTALDYINGTALNKSIFLILDFSLTKETRDDIKSFFKEVSDTPNTKGINLTYTLVNKGDNEVPAVGNFSPDEVKTKAKILGAKLIAKEIRAQVDAIRARKKAYEDLKKGDPTEAAKSLGSLFSGK